MNIAYIEYNEKVKHINILGNVFFINAIYENTCKYV